MTHTKEDFIRFMAERGALSFGDFTLKSGRSSPFYMNAGAYTTGGALATLGEFYAAAIHASFGDGFDALFGPAYKGIPLAVATSKAYFRLFGKEVEIKGLIVSLDRQEKASAESSSSALEEMSEAFGFPATSIVTMKEAVSFLKKTPIGGKILIDKETATAISKYYSEYGAGTWER